MEGCGECAKAWKKAYEKSRERTPEYKAYKKARAQTPEYKAYQKTYNESFRQTLTYKTYEKARAQAPERKVKKRIYDRKRESRKKFLPCTFTIADWYHAVNHFKHSCAYCGEFSQDLHQEHFIPVVKGGCYTPDNIVPACPKCNMRKSTKAAREFLNEIGNIEKYEVIASYLQARANHL